MGILVVYISPWLGVTEAFLEDVGEGEVALPGTRKDKQLLKTQKRTKRGWREPHVQ